MIKIEESLYDRDSTRATLWLRRLQAWGLYLCVLGKLEKIPQLLEHPLALRACVLIFATRNALQSQCPEHVKFWFEFGR